MKLLVTLLFALVLFITLANKNRFNSEPSKDLKGEETLSTISDAASSQLSSEKSSYLNQAQVFMSNRPDPDEIAPDWIYGFMDLVEQWAASCDDPQEVLTFIERLEPFELREALLESAFTGLGQGDLEKALAAAYALADEGNENLDAHLRSIVSGQITKGNYQEMETFISNFPEESSKSFLYDFAFDDWVSKDPVSLARSLENLSEESEKKLLTAKLASDWAEIDPVKASEYVLTIPAGERRANAFLSLVDSWGKDSPEAVGDSR